MLDTWILFCEVSLEVHLQFSRTNEVKIFHGYLNPVIDAFKRVRNNHARDSKRANYSKSIHINTGLGFRVKIACPICVAAKLSWSPMETCISTDRVRPSSWPTGDPRRCQRLPGRGRIHRGRRWWTVQCRFRSHRRVPRWVGPRHGPSTW